MRFPFKKIAWLLLLVNLLTSLSAYGFSAGSNPRWLAHELDHHGIVAMSAEHQHAALHLSDSEHRLMHCSAQFHPFFVISIFHGFADPAPRTIPVPAHLVAPYRVEAEPPYRPPQGLSSI